MDDLIAKWAYYKRLSRRCSAALAATGASAFKRRASAIYQCADELVAVTMDGQTHMYSGAHKRCRDRVCPLCEWRLTLTRAAQLTDLLTAYLDRYGADRSAWMLCLTVRNCVAADLADTISGLLTAWRRLLRQQIAADWCGTVRALEVTVNTQMRTYHPHLHALVTTPAGCGNQVRAQLSEAWGRALGAGYNPVVYWAPAGSNVGYEIGKSSITPAVSYVAGCKGDKEGRWDYLRDPALLGPLAVAMRGRRTMAYTGEIADLRRELAQLPEEAAEIAADAEMQRKLALGEAQIMIRYAWDAASNAYTAQSIQQRRINNGAHVRGC